MNEGALSASKQLCRLSIDAAIVKLCEIGTWPRPPAARRLRCGYDFYINDLQDIQEVNDFIQHLASDDKIKSIYFRESSSPDFWLLYEFWQRLFLTILLETEGMSPHSSVFNKWFGRFMRELYSETAVWRTVDTITGLTVYAAELRLDQATKLTSIPGYDLRGTLAGQEQYCIGDWLPGGFDKATIITTVKMPKHCYAGSAEPYEYLMGDISRSLAAIDAIRLTKPGVPRLHYHARCHLSNFPLDDPFAYCRHEGGHRTYEKEAVLDTNDFRYVRNTWRELMDTRYKGNLFSRTPDAMDTAYSRFSRSYEYRNWLDNIVDLTIALESLFAPTDNQELSYRISLRAAWLLSFGAKDDGDSVRDKNEIYDRVRTMYAIRSAGVHGRRPKEEDILKWLKTLSGIKDDHPKDMELYMLALESARDIVRKAIRACAKLQKLKSGAPRWPLPRNFDENIVIAGQRRIWQKAAGTRTRG